MESSQDDGRSTTVLCYSGQREGEAENMKKKMGWGGGVMGDAGTARQKNKPREREHLKNNKRRRLSGGSEKKDKQDKRVEESVRDFAH